MLARWPSRRTSSSGLAAMNVRVAAADREHVARRERLPQQPEHRAEVVVERRMNLDLARQHDLLELAGADPLDRPATASS